MSSLLITQTLHSFIGAVWGKIYQQNYQKLADFRSLLVLQNAEKSKKILILYKTKKLSHHQPENKDHRKQCQMERKIVWKTVNNNLFKSSLFVFMAIGNVVSRTETQKPYYPFWILNLWRANLAELVFRWINVIEMLEKLYFIEMCLNTENLFPSVCMLGAITYPGERSQGEQHHGVRTKALILGLGTVQKCLHRVYVRTEKNIAEIYFWRKNVTQPDSVQRSLGHQHTIIPLSHHQNLWFDGETVVLTMDKSYCYHYYFYI